MRRIIIGGSTGRSNILTGLMFTVITVLGLALLLVFLFTAFAFAVVLIPVGLLLYAAKKVFFPGKKTEPEAKERVNEPRDIDIIDVTEYETADKEQDLLEEGK